jgi:hypothetical protein
VSGVNKKQVKAIQALWHVHARREIGIDPADRDQRLKFFSNFCQRQVPSTNDLSFDEASRLIESLKKSLGQRVAKPARPRDREFATALGREGRRGNRDNSSTLVDPRSLEVIREYRERLMWTEAEFNSWLVGRSSPLRGRISIRTVGDARQVQWAMKGILKQKGLWREKQAL